LKIALLTKYGDMAASTRQRFLQYQPFLLTAGIETVQHALLDNAYLSQIYSERRQNFAYVASRYVKRLNWLRSNPDVDAIWLHCEVFPFLPSLAERMVSLPGKPIIFDFDDAIFHNYDLHTNRLVRFALGQKLKTTIGQANMAFCGNAYLAKYTSELCPRTEVVPTVVDTSVYCPPSKLKPKNVLVNIGWIGTPSTWMQYMHPMLPVFIETAAKMGARLSVMGAERNALPHPLLDFVDWSVDCEVPFLQNIDIGVMPLTDTPWARGKCGYKLIQYMACGLPVIASPVGVNCDIVEHGVNGFLVETEAEWVVALNALISDSNLRLRMGAAGREKVKRDYSLQVYGPKITNLLLEMLKLQGNKFL